MVAVAVGSLLPGAAFAHHDDVFEHPEIAIAVAGVVVLGAWLLMRRRSRARKRPGHIDRRD